MISAKIDPGSAVVAVAIFADDAAPPFVVRYLDAHPFPVGTITKHDPPLTGHYRDRVLADGTVKPGGPWTRHETREVTEADEQRVAAHVVAALVAFGVQEVTIEQIGHAFGDSVGAVLGKARQLGSTGRISSSIMARCEGAGITVRPGPLAVTWRARLAPLVREHGGNVAGPAIRGKGATLDPVLAALIQNWPAGDTWGEKEIDHVRVTGGLALWGALPPLPGRARKSTGAPRKRSDVAAPREHLTVEELRARRVAKKARVATDSRAKIAAARVAAGCPCGSRKGRHAVECPLHVTKTRSPRELPALCRACYRPIAAHARPCAA